MTVDGIEQAGAQLADVARPIVHQQQVHGLGRDLPPRGTRPLRLRLPWLYEAWDRLRRPRVTSAVPDAELGAFLRRKGLHEAQLREWRQQVLAGLDTAPARTTKQAPQSRRVKELEKELRRKEKALAEAAALLVLQKKVRAIWGEPEDEKSSYGNDKK